jgi:PAS domain-containing protein
VSAATSDGLLRLRERARALDTAWLASLVVVLAGIGAPWFLRALDLDLAPVLWTAFGFGVYQLLAAAIRDRLVSRRAFVTALALVRASMVVLLAILWHRVGGLDHPSFLLAFFVPVTAGGVLLARREALATAGFSFAAAGMVAAAESAELRWYLFQIGFPIESLSRLLPSRLPGRAEPFPGLATGPAFQLTFLVAFGLMLLAAPVLAELAAREMLRLSARRRMAQAAQPEAEGVFQAALRADPVPTVLVYSDTAQVVDASRAFVNQMLLAPEDLEGRTLFELLAFADAKAVRELLSCPSGELAFCGYRIGPEARVAHVRSYRVKIGSDEYACVSVRDQNELFHLSKALDGLEDAMLVIREEREVAYFNEAAQRLFAGVHFGMDAGSLLEVPGEPRDWWAPREESERETRAQLHGRSFQVRSMAARPDGAAGPLTLIRLRAA